MVREKWEISTFEFPVAGLPGRYTEGYSGDSSLTPRPGETAGAARWTFGATQRGIMTLVDQEPTDV